MPLHSFSKSLHVWSRVKSKHVTKVFNCGVQVDEGERVIITSNKYFKDLEKLLSKTPKRVVANYMLWRAARASINFSNKAIFVHQIIFFTRNKNLI